MERRLCALVIIAALLTSMLVLSFKLEPVTIAVPDDRPTTPRLGKGRSYMPGVLLIQTYAQDGEIVISPDPAGGWVADTMEWSVSFDIFLIFPFATHVKIAVQIDPLSGKNPWGESSSRESPMISYDIEGWRWSPPEATNTSGTFTHTVGIFYEVDPEVFIKLWEGNGTIILKRIIEVPTDYPTIQEAINNANDGDTVFVRNGTYIENVFANKTLHLIGEDPVSTAINGTFKILADNVQVERLCVQGDQGIELEDVKGCKISETVSRDSKSFGILLLNTSDSFILFNEIDNNYYDGVCLDHSSNNNTISFNDIRGFNRDGIGIHQSTFNEVEANTIQSTGRTTTGLHVRYALNNTFNENKIASCTTGVWMEISHNNTMYHNSFANNSIEACVPDSAGNVWDDGYPSGGNYWSDYTGMDLFSGPFQNETGSDGIGDTHYTMDANNTDGYPLMIPWGSLLGDVNGDGYVGIDDIYLVASHFGREAGDPEYNRVYDLNGDGYVGVDDIFTVAKHFGEEDP